MTLEDLALIFQVDQVHIDLLDKATVGIGLGLMGWVLAS